MIKIEVEVTHPQHKPYVAGNAVVTINDKEYANLRSCESIVIIVPDATYSVSVNQPVGLNDV